MSLIINSMRAEWVCGELMYWEYSNEYVANVFIQQQKQFQQPLMVFGIIKVD